MKKTILALAILATGSANAAINAYDKGGVKVDVSGSAEVQVYKSRFDVKNGKVFNEDAKIRLADGDMQVNLSIILSEDLKAIAENGFKYEDENVENDALSVGLDHKTYGTFTIGRQTTLVDDSGIANDIEFGLGWYDSNGDTKSVFVVTSADEVAKYKLKTKNYWLGASYAQKNDASIKQKNSAVDLGAGISIGNTAFNAYFQDVVKIGAYKSKSSQNSYQLETTYKFGDLKFGASYSDSEAESQLYKIDLETIKITAAYTINKTTFAVGADRGEISVSGKNVVINNYYANTTYKFNDNANAYGEIGYAKSDDVDKFLKANGANLELGYVVGLEVKF